MSNDFYQLNNGINMPKIGLGVYNTTEKTEMQNAVCYALDAGYRSFDTAQMYQNEAILGTAIKNTGINREEIFITSKVNTMNMGYHSTMRTFEESLEKLQTNYLDLFLIHWPGQQKDRCIETWQAMEKLYQQNKVRAIGVCNCLSRHLNWLIENCEITPAVNQVERHPLLNQQELTQWCRQHQIQMEAWAPLIRGNFDLPNIKELCQKYGKTPAQIILRWDIQSDFVVIPKSVHKERIIENISIFDFSLEQEDMEKLNCLNTGHHTSYDVETYDF